MYFKYTKEREGNDSLVKDYGFCIYSISNKECFLIDMYIDPDFRGTRKGSELMEELATIAKSQECEMITAREYPHLEQTSHSMLCALKNGFKILSSNNEFIVIGKRI